MKEKFTALLLLTYKAQGITAKTAETLYDAFGSDITEEAQIETKVKGVENIVKAFQSQEDARVQTAVTKVKAEKVEPIVTTPNPVEKKVETVIPAEETATEKLLRTLTETVGNLATKLDGFEKTKVVDTRKNQFLEAVKDMPEAFKNPIIRNIERLLPTFSEEEFTSELAKIQTDYSAYQTNLTKLGVSNFPKPNSGSPSNEAGKLDEKSALAIAEQILNN